MPKITEEISLEEVLECRKDVSDDDGGIYKAVVQKTSWNDEERSAVFVMSAETEDRYRDIVVQDGIDLTHFEKNPMALFGHRSWDMPIGLWSDIKTVRSSPKRTEGKMTFTAEGVDELADRAARHVKAGTLRACSIGFQAKKVERILDDEGRWTYGLKFHESELFECSIVTIPAVREALRKGAGHDMKEIMSPEVIEEFLEQIKSMPAVAKMVDQKLFNQVYREITGNKTHSIATVDVECPRPEWLDDLTKAAERMELAASGVASPIFTIDAKGADLDHLIEVIKKQGPGKQMIQTPDEPVIDPIHKAAHDAVEKALSEVEPELDTLTEDETERKSGLSALFDRVRSIFTPAEPEKPALAAQETKEALRARLEQIKAATAA